jgi:dimeric dUTPase (all-alpha-NTP-PPase superfamily)
MIAMNFEKLFAMQKALDSHIEITHNLENENLINRKILALLVELGELANETRCFKFWSLKQPSEKKIILEEFVDGVHFILSLGLECGYDHMPIEISRMETNLSVSELFIEIYKSAGYFQESRTYEQYVQLWDQYMKLAKSLGFSFEDIEQAYIRKNEVNYERQQSGY